MRSPGTNAVDGDAGGIRRRQLLLFSAIAAAAFLALAFWLAAGGGGSPRPEGGITAELAGLDTVEEAWTRRSGERFASIEGRLREMEAANQRLGEENTRLRERLSGDGAGGPGEIDRQAARIDALERRLDTAAESGSVDGSLGGGGNFFAPDDGYSEPVETVRPESMTGPMIESFELWEPGAFESGTLEPGATATDAGLEMEAPKPLGAWLPAGSHAEAVVLAGVDASAGVASQGDPRPVLLRITGPAWTAAADGTALSVDLEGCTVTGAAYGDLSSEKIYVRLRKMTCAGATPGTVVETEVAGFVAGSGKAGVRGPVVSREGALVEKAFLAGLVSGAGQGVSNAFQPQAVATGTTAAVANTGLGDIGRAGLGAGAASAGQKVADYMIRRAEQYQPVIQLMSGTRVTVVFLEGAGLQGLGLDGIGLDGRADVDNVRLEQ